MQGLTLEQLMQQGGGVQKPQGFTLNELKSGANTSIAQQPQKTGLEKTAGTLDTIFGGGKVGEAIGTQIARGTFGKTLQKLVIGRELSTEEEAQVGRGPSGREFVGSALQSASLFAPVGRIAGAIGSGARALGASTQLASRVGAVGAGAATGQAFQTAQNLQTGEKALSPGGITAIGAGIPLAGIALSKVNNVIKTLASKTPETQMKGLTESLSSVRNAFERESRIVFQNGKRVVKSNPITTLSKKGYVPSVADGKIVIDPVKERIQQDIDALAAILKDDIGKTKKTIPFAQFKKEITDAIKNNKSLKASGAIQKTLKQADIRLNDYARSYGKRIPAEVISDIRVAMNRVFDPTEYDTARAIGDGARKLLYDTVPTSRNLLLQEGELIAASNFLNSLAGKAVKGGRLGGYFANLVGAIAGSTTGLPIIGPVIGALGGKAIQNRIANSYFNPIGSGIARGIVKAEGGTMGILQKLAPRGSAVTPGDRLLQGKSNLIKGAVPQTAGQAKITDPTKFTRAKDLSPENRDVETKAFDKITKNEDQILADYKAKYDKTVNPDNFRPVFKDVGYRGSNAAAVQEPASYFGKRAFTEGLKNDGDVVLALSGGSGVGKTVATAKINKIQALKDKAAVIFDSNLSSWESAIAKVREARNVGKEFKGVFTYREPLDALENGVVKRMKENPEEMGRLVPTKIIAGNHIGSWDVTKKLTNEGVDGKKVPFLFVDNSLGKNGARLISQKEMAAKIKYPSAQELTSMFNKKIEELYKKGTIDKREYQEYIS